MSPLLVPFITSALVRLYCFTLLFSTNKYILIIYNFGE